MASTYRVTITDTSGVEELITGLTQDDVDALTDEHEVRDSAFPVGRVERRRPVSGEWAPAGGWDVRPRDFSAPLTGRTNHAARTAEMQAVAAINDAADRRDVRRERYLRTGR